MRLPMTDRDTLCIDWDERSLRLLNANISRSGVQVRNAVLAAIPPEVDVREPAAFGAFIRKTLGEHRIRTRRAIVDVPRQDAVLNMLTLPKGTVDELSAMVQIQIGRELPFNKDQAVIDFAVMREDQAAGTCDAWVAAVRSSIIDRYVEIIAAAGLKLDRIGLRSYANLVAVKSEAGAAAGRTLMVDVGPHMTEINVVRDGRLVYSRAASVSIPPEGLTGAAAPAAAAPARSPGDATIPFKEDTAPPIGAMDALLVEVSRTVEAYRATDPGARVDRILLAGTGGLNEEVVAAFERRFGSTTSIFEPPPALRWRAGKGESAAPFSAVIGLALCGPGESLNYFNFLHPKEPEAAARERVKRVPMVAVVIGLFVAAGAVAAYTPIRRNNARVEDLNVRINAANVDKKDREELTKQLADVDDWQKKNVIWLDTLSLFAEEIFDTNQDAYLTQMDFNESGKITFEIAAADEKVAGELAEAASQIKDEKKKPLFFATLGKADENKEPKYPVKDEVFLQISALAPQPRARH